MNYWDEVKRIQIELKQALHINTMEATAIIDGITGKLGYLFTMSYIHHADKRDDMLRTVAELEKKGEQLELIKVLKDFYDNQKTEYLAGGELTEDEIVQNASTLEQVISQLEKEVKEYITKH
jgi:uncharacterized protein (DUF2164 family)